jgi:hypothetical protein
MSRLGAAIALAAALLIVLVARPARAWVDVHVEADDIRVAIEKNGDARVEHRITLRIAGGPLRALDVRGVDPDAAPDADGYVVPQKEAARGSLASAFPVLAERMPEDTKPRPDGAPAPTVLRIRFDRDKGLGRGVYVVLVRYATHLAAKAAPGDALARITWHGPVWDDGLDSARVTFDLPAAPNEPRVDDAAGADAAGPACGPSCGPAGDRTPLVLSTVHRGTARDQIELLRPYAPKGEAVTWAIRADARAFAAPAPARPAGAPSGTRWAPGAVAEPAERLVAAVAGIGLFVLYAALVAWKSVEVARGARAAGVAPRPLVPVPAALRAIVAGAALVGGVYVEIVVGRATLGAILVVVAVAMAAHRTPRVPRGTRLRGPGRWLPVAEAQAFRDPPRPAGAWLDVSTRAGKVLFVTLLGAVLGAAFVLHDTRPASAQLVGLDATAILAIFCTGRLRELPPDPGAAPAPLLRAIAKRLRRLFPAGDVRLVGRIRVPDGCADPDEIRLSVAPRAAPAGFAGIEVGVVYVPGAGGAIALPEVLVRVKTGSPCEAALGPLARHGRATRGRRPNERVIAFTPLLPTARMTAALTARLVRAVTTADVVRTREPARRAA